MSKKQVVRGTLVSHLGGWAIREDDGTVHVVRGVEERNISAHVGKKRWWVLYQYRGKRWAQRDRRTAAERAAGTKAKLDNRRESVRTVSGGAPGLGKRRR